MDEESTESSSAPSPSPPPSPEASFHGPPSLERLVAHFVTAKRSLTCISHVARANGLVTEGRTLIEEIATTTARNSFARHGVDEQLDTLNAIRDGIVGVSEAAAAEFTETVKVLDEANDRLQGTLEKLRQTIVDAALQRGGESEANDEHEGEENEDEDEEASPRGTRRHGDKTLYDFIDEHRHQDIADSLRSLIDSYNSAQGDLHSTLALFDDHLRTIAETLQEPTVTGSGPQDKRTLYDEPPPTIPQLFRNMDTHAGEMAQLLHNLVAHYDLCVTALKHTEGGGEAAKAAIQQAEDFNSAKNIAGAPAEESLYRKTAPEPLGEKERAEMLRVLESDANEVEEVVAELREHAEGMDRDYGSLTRHVLNARAGHKALRSVLDQLYEIKEALPRYIAHSRDFREAWQSVRAAIEAHTSDLSTLSVTYEDFMTSYSHLLSEVERRKAADAAIQKFASRAQRELDRLYQADVQARKEFMEEFGESLPRDIWLGAGEKGRRWEVRPAGGRGSRDQHEA